MLMLNPVDLPEVLREAFPEGVIADIWRDPIHNDWVIGDFDEDHVAVNMTFEHLSDAENALLQNNIAYRIREY